MKRKLAYFLALCLLLGTLGACRRTDPPPEETPSPTEKPQTIVKVPEPDQQPDTTISTVDGEEVTLTLVSGSFQRTGGPDFSLYVDKNRYQVNDVDGCCYITTDEGSTYAEIGFRPETDAETLSAGFLSEYGNMQDSSDLGEQTLGSNSVRKLAGRTMDSAFEAFLLNTEEGCVTMVVCSPLGDASPMSAVATDAVRLVDALRTLTLS